MVIFTFSKALPCIGMFQNCKQILSVFNGNIRSGLDTCFHRSFSSDMGGQSYLKYIFTQANCQGKKLLSVELYSSGVDKIDFSEITKLNPSFCNFTWNDKGDYSDIDSLQPIKVAMKLSKIGQQMVIHMGSRDFDEENARRLVNRVKEIGVKNILALKGASMRNPDDSTRDFPYALDFVKFLRREYEDYFNIGVSGYPIGHPASADPVKDIPYLKDKVDAGADFVFCQAVFDVETFKIFYKRCRDIGIDVPIIPGVYALDDNNVLSGVKGFCKIIPEKYTKFFEENKDDKEALANFSVEYTANVIRGLMKEPEISIPGVHVFCFNNFSLVQRVFDELDYDDLKIQRPQKKNNM